MFAGYTIFLPVMTSLETMSIMVASKKTKRAGWLLFVFLLATIMDMVSRDVITGRKMVYPANKGQTFIETPFGGFCLFVFAQAPFW